MSDVAKHRGGLVFKGRNVTRRHFTCDISILADEPNTISKLLAAISRYRRVTPRANLLWCHMNMTLLRCKEVVWGRNTNLVTDKVTVHSVLMNKGLNIKGGK